MKNAKSTTDSIPDRSDAQDVGLDRTDWARVRATTDSEIEAAIMTDPDEVGMRVDWSRAKVVVPDRKKTMTIRIDGDVLDFYRGMGRGYQTTINAVLRSYMNHGKS